MTVIVIKSSRQAACSYDATSDLLEREDIVLDPKITIFIRISTLFCIVNNSSDSRARAWVWV